MNESNNPLLDKFMGSLYDSMVRHEVSLDFNCPDCNGRVRETNMLPTSLHHFDCDCGYVMTKSAVTMTPELWAGMTKTKYEEA